MLAVKKIPIGKEIPKQLIAGLHGDFVFQDGLHGVFGDRDRFVHVEIAFENVR